MATALSIFALTISLIGLAFAIWSWRESNRPIVVGYIETVQAGNIAIALNLVVENVGSRPASNVSLAVSTTDLERARSTRSKDTFDELCERCFDDRAIIPVLKPSERRVNSFGKLTGTVDSTWIPESRLPITITYREYGRNRKFKAHCNLLLSDSTAFAGGIWHKKKNTECD